MGQFSSIAVVARRTGLYPDTIRAWERRHRLIEPRREPSGVRTYSDKDIVRLELARDATRLGHAIRHVAGLSNTALRRLVRSQTSKSSSGALDDSAGLVVSETLDAIKRYDLRAAQHSLTAAALALPTDEFALRILAPLLRRVGEDWGAGNIEIAQEHLVSQLVRNLSGSIALQRFGTATVSTIFATPPGEHHEFGITLCALIAAGRGCTSAIVGPSVPAEDLARAARQMNARTIVIGSTASADDLSVPAFLRALSDSVTGRPEIWLGGPHAAALCKKSGKQRIQAIPTLEAFAARLSALHGKRWP